MSRYHDDYDRRDRDYDRDYDRRDYDRRDYDRRDYDRRDYDRRDRDSDYRSVEGRLVLTSRNGEDFVKLGNADVTKVAKRLLGRHLHTECDDQQDGYCLSRHLWSAEARLGDNCRIYLRNLERGGLASEAGAAYDDYDDSDDPADEKDKPEGDL